jgi:hypothetical protein
MRAALQEASPNPCWGPSTEVFGSLLAKTWMTLCAWCGMLLLTGCARVCMRYASPTVCAGLHFHDEHVGH